jgi:hypothetical protein
MDLQCDPLVGIHAPGISLVKTGQKASKNRLEFRISTILFDRDLDLSDCHR